MRGWQAQQWRPASSAPALSNRVLEELLALNLTEIELALCGNEGDIFSNVPQLSTCRFLGRSIRGNVVPPGSWNWPLSVIGATGPIRRGGGSALASGGGWTPWGGEWCRAAAAAPPRYCGTRPARACPAPPRRIPRPRPRHPAPLPRCRPHARRILAFSPPSSADPTRTKSLDRSRGVYVTSTISTFSAVRRSWAISEPHVTLQMSLQLKRSRGGQGSRIDTSKYSKRLKTAGIHCSAINLT